MIARSDRHQHQEPPAGPRLVSELSVKSRPLRSEQDLDPLLDRIGDARYVLLGEASHGTHEYYSWRAAITRRLIEEKDFSFIAVEGDWPDCYRVNRFVKGENNSGESARDVLHAYERWPTWMWANEDVVQLVEYLETVNLRREDRQKVGFYGLDVYSLWDSLYQVLGYVRQHDPESLHAAQAVFRCFEPFAEDVQEYARAAHWSRHSCKEEIVSLLTSLLNASKTNRAQIREATFNAQQNAMVVRNAEHYYRIMVEGGPESWNLRDRHMTETLERLMTQHGAQAKAIVWEHNTHIGDARFTDMACDGMVNVGQLVRESHPADDVVLVGFASYSGSVIAAREWEATCEKMSVPRARQGSWEQLLHEATEGNDRLLIFNEMTPSAELLEERGHRAIGVVYRSEYESRGNYVPTVLPKRYDALLYLDHTTALSPLHQPEAIEHEVPETFPSGF